MIWISPSQKDTAIRAHLEKLVRLDRTWVDFVKKFEALIESYNLGSRSIGDLLEELVKFTQGLSAEEQRHARENVFEEKLVIFDILTRPAPELTPEERSEVKKVARELLERLKQVLVLNWRQKSSARSKLRLAIEDVLDGGLPRAYGKPSYEQKHSALFEHVCENYLGEGEGTYAARA
jgi:type I restriction enzyme R subunit